jgi:hypothetical protein
MKLNFLKFKKNNLPPLQSLRPQVFDTDLFWYLSLGVCFLLFLIMALVGFNLSYSQYFESYKNSAPVENSGSIINTDRLGSAIQKRNEFINQQISLPKDPSL